MGREKPPRATAEGAERVSSERTQRFHEELTRFPADLFQFDPRIRDGWLSDRYFVRTARTLMKGVVFT